MKFAFLAIALLGVVPLSFWLRDNPRYNRSAWIAVGFLPFGITAIPHLYIAVVSWPTWPGAVKGLEITALDFLLFALWLNLPKRRESLPFKTAMILYFIASILSLPFAEVPQASSFYVWQLARMFFAYSVVGRASADAQVTESILTGLLLGLCYEALIVIWQRFALGDVQTPGTLGHQNTLGMMSHLVVFPLFAFFLAGKNGWQAIAAPVVGILIAILTVSRATIGIAGLAYLLLFVFAALRRWTPRLAKIALVAAISMTVIVPVTQYSFDKRFAAAPLSDDYDERAAFENAATSMLSDHPLGVGANNFVTTANTGGYYDRAGVVPNAENRAAHVHNAYLLAAAETGYLGAIAFVVLLALPLITAFRFGWSKRRDNKDNLLLGLGVGLLAIYLQSFYEWTFFLFYPQYMFAITIGMIAGLSSVIRASSAVPRMEKNTASIWTNPAS